MARACLVAAKRIVNTLPLSLIQLLRKIARKCVFFFVFFLYNYDVTIFFFLNWICYAYALQFAPRLLDSALQLLTLSGRFRITLSGFHGADHVRIAVAFR